MTLQKDINGYWKDTKEGEYNVRFTISGSVSLTVNAGSEEEAKAKVEAILDDEEALCDVDEITDADVSFFGKSPDMYLIRRNGKDIRSSQVLDGDEPREPNQSGF